MSGHKWQVGKITVGGSAMFGDHNRMVIHADGSRTELTPETVQSIQALLGQLQATIAALAAAPNSALSAEKRASAEDGLRVIVGEMENKERPPQSTVLERALKAITTAVEHVPSAVTLAKSVGALLGF